MVHAFPSPAAALLLALLAGSPAFFGPVEATAQSVAVSGEVRPRLESRTPPFPSAPDADLTVRLRAGMETGLGDGFRVFVAGQGVLLAGGEEGVTLDGQDPELFAGFVEVSGLPGETSLRAGRQEVTLGNQRLVSHNNWGQRGQRFDAVRLSGRKGLGRWTLFGGRVAALDGYAPRLGGLHMELDLGEQGEVHGYLLGSRDRASGRASWPTGEPEQVDRVTLGGHGELPFRALTLLVEGYVQRGKWGDDPVGAWMASAGVRSPLGPASLEVRWDLLSGDEGGGDGPPTGAFDRLRGSNHGFHGRVDVFTRFPASTEGEGFSDLRLQGTLPLGERLDMEGAIHRFATLVSPESRATRLGEEVDVVLRGRPGSGVSMEVGAGYLRVGPALERLREARGDVRVLHAMVTFAF